MPLFNPAKLSEQYATTFYLPSSITAPGLIPINNLLMSDGQGGTFYSDTLYISTVYGTSSFMNSITTQFLHANGIFSSNFYTSTIQTSTLFTTLLNGQDIFSSTLFTSSIFSSSINTSVISSIVINATSSIKTEVINLNDVYLDIPVPVYSSNAELYYKNEQVTNTSIKYKSEILDSTVAIVFDDISLRVSVATLGFASFQIKTATAKEFDALNSGYATYNGNSFTQYSGELLSYNTAYKDIHEWTFEDKGDTAIFNIHDLTFSRMFRITGMLGEGYNSNVITIERLYP